MRVPVIVWFLPLVFAAAEVTPGAHLSRCVTDSTADGTANFARTLMTSSDSSTRSEFQLPRLTPGEIQIVADSTTCTAAATAFVNGQGREAILPEQVAVVRAGPYFFVEVIKPPPPDPEVWEIALFTREWKRVVSFGGGS